MQVFWPAFHWQGINSTLNGGPVGALLRIPSRGDAQLAPTAPLAALTAVSALTRALTPARSATAAVLASAAALGSSVTLTALLADVVRARVFGVALAAAVAVAPTGILVAAALTRRSFFTPSALTTALAALRTFVVTAPVAALSLLAVAAVHLAATLDALGRRVHVMALAVLALLPVLAVLTLFAPILLVHVAGNSGALAGIGRLRARGSSLGRSALGLVVVSEGGREQ
jgi:hypothetical protein